MRVREAISGLGAVLLATAAGNSEHYMFTAGALLLAYAALLPGVVMQRDPQNEHATIFSWGAGQVVTGRVANKKRKRLSWAKREAELTDMEFVRRYKLSKVAFRALCGRIAHLVGTPSNHKKAKSSSGSRVPTELCLSMTLRYLAEGNVWDIVDIHGVSQALFYQVLWRTVAAINEVEALPGLPSKNMDRVEALSKGFSVLNKDTLHGCVGVIDGIAIEIGKPTPWDTIYRMQYRNRKNFFSVNCQAICDSNLKFLWCSLKSPGGTHDSLAWRSTHLHHQLEEIGLPQGYYLVGDDAYACREWMVTPYPSKNLTREKSDFNFYQSRTRITIERAFGVLVQRWGILRRPMTCSTHHTVDAVRCCMRLHNLCIDEGVPEVDPIRGEGKYREVNVVNSSQTDDFRLPRQSDGIAFPLTSTQRQVRKRTVDTSKRDQLCAFVLALGIRRPATSVLGLGIDMISRKRARAAIS